MNVAVRVTIHRHNVDDLENIAHLLLEELGLPGFGTNSAGYLGTCRLNADDVMLTIAERQLAMATLLRLAEKYPDRISANAGPLAEGRAWRRMEEARAQGAPAFPNRGPPYRVRLPEQQDLRARRRRHRSVHLCWPICELGRINQDSLAEIWQHSPALNQLRSRHTIPLTEFEFCAGCSYIPYCTGNCPGLAYTITGQVDHPSPDACLRRFLEEGGTIP